MGLGGKSDSEPTQGGSAVVMTRRALGLVRVSPASQVDGYSLDAQRSEVERWCANRGFVLIQTLIEEGVSARTDKQETRPLLRQALEMATRGEYDLLVVHTLDRLARNQKVQRQVLKSLGKASVGFASVVEGVDYTTPPGKLLMSGSSIQSDRHRFGGAMYRERHANSCRTNGRSSVAGVLDDQIGKIIMSLELPDSWQERMAQLVCSGQDGPGVAELQEKRRRLGVAYADGAFSDLAYRARQAEIDAEIRKASAVVPPSLDEAAALFGDIETLWKEATAEERRELVSPLIERPYVDMDLKLVGAIAPTPAFRALLQCAARKSDSNIILASQDELERLDVWSWWRRGRIELPLARSSDVAQRRP
jgi:hypothetical protein